MTSTSAQVKKYRRMFGLGFLLSLVALVALMLLPEYEDMSSHHLPGDAVSSSHAPVLLAGISLVSSVTTLCGLILTTIVAWRKEKREENAAKVELEIKMAELEKLRIDNEIARRDNMPNGS